MPKTKGSKPKDTAVCVLCKSAENDELRLGKFYRSKELSVHNFCMLFASNLSQNGKDDDGFAGFLPKDIKKEVERGRKLKCSYCKTTGATIGCCIFACKRVFHLNCGLKHNSLHLFYDDFGSYCSVHKAKPIYPEGEPLTNEYTCSICCDTIFLKDYDTTVWGSCCKNGWFHKPCVQKQAHSAGYFFRCPLCNNTEQFQKQMLRHGIYIPQQDAAWELEENAFQELLIRHEQCDAVHCLCPKGRKYHTKTSHWRLILCEDCGSQGRHVGCDDSITPKGTWKCHPCIEITERMQSKKVITRSRTTETTQDKQNKKKKKNSSKPQPSQGSSNVVALRRSVRSTSSLKDKTDPTSEEPRRLMVEIPLASLPKFDGSSSTDLCGSATSLTKSKHKVKSMYSVHNTPTLKNEILTTSEKPSIVLDEIPLAFLHEYDGPSSTALCGGVTSFTKTTYVVHNTPSFKDEIHPSSQEPFSIKVETISTFEPKCDRASCSALRGSPTSLNNSESTYKITKISKRGKEDLSKFNENSGFLGISSETKEPLEINLKPGDYTHSSNSDQENAIDLFSDVVASVSETDSDSSPYKSEIFHQDETNELNELQSSSQSCHSLNECNEVIDLSVATCSASHLCDNNRSANLKTAVCEIPSVKNEFCLQADSSLTVSKDSGVTSAALDNVDREMYLSQNTTPLDTSFKENIKKEELKKEEMSTVEDSLSNFSFSPSNLKNTYKMHRERSKRICVNAADKHSKKQKLNNSSEQSHSLLKAHLLQDVKQNTGIRNEYSVNPNSKTANEVSSPTLSSGSVVLSKRICVDAEDKDSKKQKLNNSSEQSHSLLMIHLVQDVKQNTGAENKYPENPNSKTANEVSSPTLSSGSVVCYSQQIINEGQSDEARDAENIVSNSNSSVITKVCDSSGYNNERRDHCESSVKAATVHNRLAKKTVRTRCVEGNRGVSQNSTQYNRTSENRPIKKSKLHVLSKKNYGTTLRCKDNYRCIKALFGGPCQCCEDKLKFTKESGTKSKSKKCSQNCRPQYSIECIGKRSEEVSLGSKHSCNRPTNYIVNFWHPGRQISTISETKEKLSVKPQVIHLKTVPH